MVDLASNQSAVLELLAHYPAVTLSLLCHYLEARVGIERGSFTVPSLTHSVSTLTLATSNSGSSNFFDRSFNATQCPDTASRLPLRCNFR